MGLGFFHFLRERLSIISFILMDSSLWVWKCPPGIAAGRFNEVVDALRKICGANILSYLGWIIHELEVLVGPCLQVADPGGLVLSEPVEQRQPFLPCRFD